MMNETITSIANWSSITSLVIAIITLILAGTIKRALNKQQKSFAFRMRATEINKTLGKKCSEFLLIYKQINNEEDSSLYVKDIRDIIHKIKVDLELLREGAPDTIKKDIAKTIKKAELFYQCTSYNASENRKYQVTIDKLYTIYTETYGVIAKVQDYHKQIANYGH